MPTTRGTAPGRASPLTPQAAIMAMFFVQAFAGATVFPRIPDIQLGLGLSEGTLGLILMGIAVGGLTSIVFASWIIERIGTRAILAVAIPAIAVATVLMALAPGAGAAFAAMVLFGLSFSLSDVTMNVEADRVEAATGRRVMNRCHGMWSLGSLVASVLGAGARGVPLTPLVHFALVLAVVVAAAALLVWSMRGLPPRPHAGARIGRVFVTPTLATLLLVGVILAGVMADTTVRAWSVIFMRDVFDAPDWVEALTLPAFLITLTAGRMLGDRLVAAFGAVPLAAALLLVALLGLVVVLIAGDPWLALLGFALIGLGVSVVFPLTMSAAAALGDRPASQNVTSVAMMISILMLGAPALIGQVAEQAGIRSAFMVLVPVLLLALALSTRLAPRPAPAVAE